MLFRDRNNMGKAHDLLDVLTKGSPDDSEHTTH